jgi:DNA-binding NarL/FixJ family response regulator
VASFQGSFVGKSRASVIVALASRKEFNITPYLRKAFGWSQAEAEVAYSLSLGKSVNKIAIERATSVSTVRTQVKTVIWKSESYNLNDLIAKIYALRYGPL